MECFPYLFAYTHKDVFAVFRNMSQKSITILLIEARADERRRLQECIAEDVDSPFALIFSDSIQNAYDALAVDTVDVILFDMSLCGDQGFDPIRALHQKAGDIPLVALAEHDDPDQAVQAIQAGAQDCLVIPDLDHRLIVRSLRYAIERQRMLTDLRFALASEKVLMEELDRKNKELVELSITDGLTGLYNHRFIQERFDFEFKRALRYRSSLACMLIDIDHFKSVNDTYGHQFGDYVLVEIANIMRSNSREVDICGRYGGEEFMAITNQTGDEAMRYAAKLHAAIEKFVFSQDGHTVHVTVSIGVAEFKDGLKKKQELIERADTALYWAKRDGRNIIRQWKEMEAEDLHSLDHMGIEGLRSELVRLSNEMRATYMESANALVRAIDAKDHYTKEHSKNVSYYAVQLAIALGLSDKEVEIIKYAGLLHDIGKIGVAQDVLLKKAKLTDEEFDILKKHPVIGSNILRDVKFLEKEVPIILHHHERWDGRGYPHGLRSREIPFGARIMGVVDAFDAMTTDRVYRPRLSLPEAIAELSRGSGSQFDPEIDEAFIGLLKKHESLVQYAHKFEQLPEQPARADGPAKPARFSGKRRLRRPLQGVHK